jgi:hypothetical protein
MRSVAQQPLPTLSIYTLIDHRRLCCHQQGRQSVDPSTLTRRADSAGMDGLTVGSLVGLRTALPPQHCMHEAYAQQTYSVSRAPQYKAWDDLVVLGGAEDASRRSHLMNCVQRCLRHRMLEAYIQQSHSVSIPMRDLALVSSYLPMLRTGLHSKQHTYSSHSSI